MVQSAQGFNVNSTMRSYEHLHFGSCPQAADHFVSTRGRRAASAKKSKASLKKTP
jgi:hypothetical protein